MRTKLLLANFFITFFFVLLSPLVASAGGASTQTTLNSPTPGVMVYSQTIHRWKVYVEQFPQFLDELSRSSSQLSTYAWPDATTSLHWDGGGNNNNGNWFNFYGDPNTALGKTTSNHVCALIDSTAVYTGSTDPNWHGSRGAEDGNRSFFYQNGSWHDGAAYSSDCGGNACDEATGKPVCTSYAAPGNTLSASAYAVSSPGTPVALTWDDSVFRDTNVDYSVHDKFSNIIPQSATSCSSSGFSLSGASYTYCSDAELLDTTPPRWLCNQWSSTFIADSHDTVTVFPIQTTTYSYVCTNANGTTNASATVDVTSAGKPDLTAGSVSPTAAAVGSATKFSATVKNQGTASTGGSFPVLYQKATSAAGANAANIGTDSSAPALAAGASETSTMDTGAALTEGTWYVRACANTTNNSTFSVSESDTANNCGEWTMVTVVTAASAKPDLTASSTSPSSANVGQATTLSATIANGGATGTSAGFPDLFEISQVNNPSLFSQIYATKSYASAALAAGSSNTASASYTFPSAGTWYVRACANTDASGNTPASSYAGTPESNYGNNCGSSWTTVTVGSVCFGQGCVSGCDASGTCPTPGCSYSWVGQPKLSPASQCCSVTPGVCPAAPTASLSASPTQVDVGQSSTLSWSSTGATSCSGTGFTAGAASGSRSTGELNSAGTQNYQVTCSGAGGTSAPAFASVEVLAPNVTITAEPARVKSGGGSTLSWSAGSVKRCTVSGPSVSISGNADKTNSFSTGSPKTIAITGQSVYTISCTTNGGPISKSITVNILPGFQEF